MLPIRWSNRVEQQRLGGTSLIESQPERLLDVGGQPRQIGDAISQRFLRAGPGCSGHLRISRQQLERTHQRVLGKSFVQLASLLEPGEV